MHERLAEPNITVENDAVIPNFGPTTTTTTTEFSQATSPYGTWMCARYCVDKIESLEGDPMHCLEPPCYGTDDRPRFSAARKTCKDMWGKYMDCLLKTPLCYEERWMFWLMTRGEVNRECLLYHRDVYLYVEDDTGAIPIVDTKQPEPWVLDEVLLVTVLLVPLCLFTAGGIVFYLVRHQGQPVQPFVPKHLPTGALPEDGIPHPAKHAAPILAKKDMIGGQYGPIMARMGEGGGMTFTVPGKRTYNVVKPNAQVMYAYPPPQKVKWAPDDPRLPQNLAAEYVREKTIQERKNILKEKEREKQLRALQNMEETQRSLQTESTLNQHTVATLNQSASSAVQSTAH